MAEMKQRPLLIKNILGRKTVRKMKSGLGHGEAAITEGIPDSDGVEKKKRLYSIKTSVEEICGWLGVA